MSFLPQMALWTQSNSAPVSTDTVWVKTPAVAGVYECLSYVSSGWRRIGWLSIDNVFSQKKPLNIVIAGQSNAAGVATGGDNSTQAGILAFGTGLNNQSPGSYTWYTAEIGKSPFYLSNQNIAFQLAKEAIAEGIADIVRIVATYEGGVGMYAWLPPSQTNTNQNAGYLLEQLKTNLTNSGIDTIDWFCWAHGESPGVTSADFDGYYADLYILLGVLRGNDVPQFKDKYSKFVMNGLGNQTSRDDIHTGASPDGAGYRLMTNDDPYVYYAPSYGVGRADGVHFSGAGMQELSKRYLAAFKQLPKPINPSDGFHTSTIAGGANISYMTNVIPYGDNVARKDVKGQRIGLTKVNELFFLIEGEKKTFSLGSAFPQYANNAAAISGGLTAGYVYYNTTDKKFTIVE